MSDIQWSEPLKPVAGEPRPAVYQTYSRHDEQWTIGCKAGVLWECWSATLDYRIPASAPTTVPYLPYIALKCEQRIRELRSITSNGLDRSDAGFLEAEMQAAIRDCANRLAEAIEQSKA